MSELVKRLLKRMLPERCILFYHRAMSRYAAYKFKHPSNKLIVIGVTGTKGKSTTCNIIWHLLTQAGYNVGMATTVNFRIGQKHWLNDTKMTMLGRTQLQSLLADMVEAGCQYAVVETSSEGIKQFRHLGINYDVAVFTNLHPEHLDAHGGFEPYKEAKLDFFRHVSNSPRKQHNGNGVPKAAVINGDSEYAAEFYQAAQVGTHIAWSMEDVPDDQRSVPVTLRVSDPEELSDGVRFKVGQYQFSSHLLGMWNITNIVSAMAVAVTQGVSYPELQASVATIPPVPGRMEVVSAGQPFTIVVDYAYEPKSLQLLYEFWRKRLQPGKKLITLISSTGGGRDVWRRPVNGKVAAELCDYSIATDEDPYDEDPQLIIDQVAEGAIQAGAVEGTNLWRIHSRFQAIKYACQLAQPGDIVILTAKGAEQKMCLAKGKKINWDDREAAKQAMRELGIIQ